MREESKNGSARRFDRQDSARQNGVVVDMSAHFDVDDQMEELARKRFSMQPAVIAAFRQAAAKGAQRLLELVDDDEKFDKLRTREKVEILNMIFDRAYGRSETASSYDLANFKTGELSSSRSKSTHAAQLSALEARMKEKSAGKSVYPEMSGATPASEATRPAKVIGFSQRPRYPTEGENISDS